MVCQPMHRRLLWLDITCTAKAQLRRTSAEKSNYEDHTRSNLSPYVDFFGALSPQASPDDFRKTWD